MAVLPDNLDPPVVRNLQELSFEVLYLDQADFHRERNPTEEQMVNEMTSGIGRQPTNSDIHRNDEVFALRIRGKHDFGLATTQIRRLVSLRSLDATHTKLKDLESICELNQMKELIIRNTPVQDFSCLRKLKQLRGLDLSDTSILPYHRS